MRSDTLSLTCRPRRARRRGNNRDADGTVDRSPPPTPEVQKLLKEVKRGIDRFAARLSSPLAPTPPPPMTTTTDDDRVRSPSLPLSPFSFAAGLALT